MTKLYRFVSDDAYIYIFYDFTKFQELHATFHTRAHTFIVKEARLIQVVISAGGARNSRSLLLRVSQQIEIRVETLFDKTCYCALRARKHKYIFSRRVYIPREFCSFAAEAQIWRLKREQ